MSEIRITHIGGPTTVIEVGGWRLLTDPTFDPPGRRYSFGWGTGSRKTSGPAISARELGPVDAVLLSHDHHADNLDESGRAIVSTAKVVVTTTAGARRLGGNAVGLEPWKTMRLQHPTHPSLAIMATPCRHGPPASRLLTGDVIGFALHWEGQRHGALWISGDTVLYEGVRQVAERVQVGTALLHLGGVRFRITGPLRYTMTAQDAVDVCRLVKPQTAIPIHYEGWGHFQEDRVAIERVFASAPDVRQCLQWIPVGTPVGIIA